MSDKVEITPVTTRRFGKDGVQTQMSVEERELQKNKKKITKTFTILAPLVFLAMIISGFENCSNINLNSWIFYSF